MWTEKLIDKMKHRIIIIKKQWENRDENIQKYLIYYQDRIK